MTIFGRGLLTSLWLAIFVLLPVSALARDEVPRTGHDYTSQMSSLFQIPAIGDRLLIVDPLVRESIEPMAQVAPFGTRFSLPQKAMPDPWNLFFTLQLYRMRPSGFRESLALSQLVFDARSRQVVLNMLGITAPGVAETTKSFNNHLMQQTDEFQKSDFNALMHRTYGQDKPFRGHVKVLNLKRIDLGVFDVARQQLRLGDTTEMFMGISGISEPRYPDHRKRAAWKMDETTARYVVRHLETSKYGSRVAYLAVRGTLYFPGEDRKPPSFFPEEIAIYYDKSFGTHIMDLKVTDLYEDLSIDRKKKQQAELAAAATSQAEQQQQIADRNAAAERIRSRPLDVLGIRLGMSEQQARAALAATSAAFSPGGTQSFDGEARSSGSLTPETCNVHRNRMRRNLISLKNSLTKANAGSTGLQPGQQEQYNAKQAELIAAMPAECRPKFDHFARYFVANASYANGKITDQVVVYFSSDVLQDSAVVAVVRRLKMQNIELNVLDKLDEKLGTDFYSRHESYRIWMTSPEHFFRVTEQPDFRNLCLPRSEPIDFNKFNVYGFQVDCGEILGAGAGSEAANIYLVDTTHLAEIRALREQSAKVERNTPVDVDF